MSLQGSIHKWSDGIGYGAFIPTDRAYYSAVGTPTATPGAVSGAVGRPTRPSSEMIETYRKHNVTAGIETHRSDISFGKTTESVCGTPCGDLRAREATKSLTSGEVGGFCWPAEQAQARDTDVATIVASSSSTTALSSTPIPSSRRRELQCQAEQNVSTPPPPALPVAHGPNNNSIPTARSNVSSVTSSSGASTWRSCTTTSLVSSARSRSSSSFISRPSARHNPPYNYNTGSNIVISDHHRETRLGGKDPAFDGARDTSNRSISRSADMISSRSSRSGSGRRAHLFGPTGEMATIDNNVIQRKGQGVMAAASSNPRSSPCSSPPRFKRLDPVFEPHRKFDLMAAEQSARGGDVTGRFGPVDGPSVLAASLVTSELSSPWSHVLRGQKW